MAKTNTNDTQKGVGLHARRVIAYVVLIIISFFCLFWFYIMFINATRSNESYNPDLPQFQVPIC